MDFMAVEFSRFKFLPYKHDRGGCHSSSAVVQETGIHPKGGHEKDETKNCMTNAMGIPILDRPSGVGLSLVAAFATDAHHQQRTLGIEGDCGCLLHGTVIRSNALKSSVSKQNLEDPKPPVASMPSEPIPIAVKGSSQSDCSVKRIHPSQGICTEAESAGGLNLRERTRANPDKEKGVLSLLPSSPVAAAAAVAASSPIASNAATFVSASAFPSTSAPDFPSPSPAAAAAAVADTSYASSLPKIDFLDACFLCGRRLRHGQDIFMYRGDTAFCSVDCRQQQILLDERAERRQKCLRGAFKTANAAPSRRLRHRLSAGTAAAA